MWKINSRRRVGQISVHKILTRLHHGTKESTLEAWKDQATDHNMQVQ